MPIESHENRLSRGELLNKRIVLFTLCGIAGLFSATVCWMVLKAIDVPDTLDRLVTFSVGNLTGILTATGITKASDARQGTPGDPLTVTAEEPLPVTDETPEEVEVDTADEYEPQPSPLSKAIRK